MRIGVLTRPHGLHGAIRLRPDNPEATVLSPGMKVFIEGAGGPEQHELTDIRPLGRGLLRVTLAQIDEISRAEALGGRILMIALTDLPSPASGQFYYFQAIGCRVITTTNRTLGTIVEIFSNGANDVIVVRDGQAELLIPVIADVIRSIELDQRRIIVEPIPGLLD